MNAPPSDPSKDKGPYVKCGEDCPYHRVGLPIFPVRYAVLRNNANSPAALSGDLAYPGLAEKERQLGSAARYGVRLLRPGYLYVYDEAGKKLDGYFVNGDNTLYRFNPDKPLKDGENNFPCHSMEHQAMASMITIPNARKATKVWLTLSDVQWTKDVCDAHRGDGGAAERKKHMVEFDVQAWLGSKKHPQAHAMVDTKSVVAEYFCQARNNLDFPGLKQQFDWTTVNWMSRQSWMYEMVEKASNWFSPGNGVMLALPDPTGIAQDVARLMRQSFDAFTNNPDDIRQLTVSKSIESLREIVQDKAETDFLNEADRKATNISVYGDDTPIFAGPGGMGNTSLGMILADKLYPEQKKAREARAEAARHPSAQARQTARNDSWKKYLEDYSEPKRVAWQQAFDKRLKDFDLATIVPLATAHVAWMKSPEMVCNFECNYDVEDVESGDVYLAVFTLCIDGVQDKRICFELLLDWLIGRATDTSNLLLRAMFHNNKLITEKVQSASENTIDWKGMPWYTLTGIYGNALKRLGAGANDRTARLVTQVLGPMTRVLKDGVDSQVARTLAVRLGVISKSPVEIVEVVGSKKKFRAALIRETLRQHGGQVDQRKMEKAVSEELRRLEVAGEKTDVPDKKRWFRMVDSEAAANVPKTGNAMDRATALAEASMSIEQYEARELTRWRTVINADVRVGAVSCVFQGVFLWKLWSDMQASMDHEKGTAEWKFVVGIAGAGGSMAEVLGNAMAGRSMLGMRLGSGLAVETTGEVVARFGGRAGIVIGVILAFFDLKAAKDQLTTERNGLMGGLYIASAALSIAVLWAFAAAATVVGIILTVALVLVTILIAVFQDNKIQEWLKRCYWGKFQGQSGTDYYYGLEQEMKNLNLALGQ
ncbi:T6SS effector BTH_I2691 family protein [Bordetella sp. LUAb4]|uniref:T6SS effector BTH_I2691 family protein n=1 Tax=Bordetella sp. LUAb4 TaxID=2843195 RepID=UPI001E3829F3|nr:T6SS effector BTH_I2691 family protein [Bordetella sp. LUAb4]